MSSNTDVAATPAVVHALRMGKRGSTENDLGARVQRAILTAGLNFTETGKRLGVTRSAVSQWVGGGTEPTPENLRGIAMETGVSFDWLATGRGQMADSDIRSEDVAAGETGGNRRKINVVGYIGANGQTGYYAVNQGAHSKIDASNTDPPNAVAVEIMGTSLGPLFDRWYAIYDDVRRPITDDMIGKLCAVWLDDDRVLIKEIRRNGKRFDLLSNDPTEEPIKNVRIKSAARVTALRPKS